MRLAEAETAQRNALSNLIHNLAGLAFNGDARALDWQSIADALQELDSWGLLENPYADPIFDRAKGEG